MTLIVQRCHASSTAAKFSRQAHVLLLACKSGTLLLPLRQHRYVRGKPNAFVEVPLQAEAEHVHSAEKQATVRSLDHCTSENCPSSGVDFRDDPGAEWDKGLGAQPPCKE